ncbi:hypothetical protein BT63DRAFT_481841 [Microthyrium microscopicum]|uniref:GAG-pre-integrase domain-containing protein n=1 Tax=Microthyrium microscopicum TaxID=703497 RepID=A0A6A6U338_9PEZI|nr:hypothetical protein BT63DRAFT_481841 [Microthyrium microscopicum]
MVVLEVIEPKYKSDSKWLKDAGYDGMPQFMISYGLKFPEDIDEAKKLIDGFREEQQAEFEAKYKRNTTDPKVIEAAMLWHRRMGHMNYHAVKELPQHSTGMDVDFSKLNVNDLPACSACSSAGMNPFEET